MGTEFHVTAAGVYVLREGVAIPVPDEEWESATHSFEKGGERIVAEWEFIGDDEARDAGMAEEVMRTVTGSILFVSKEGWSTGYFLPGLRWDKAFERFRAID